MTRAAAALVCTLLGLASAAPVPVPVDVRGQPTYRVRLERELRDYPLATPAKAGAYVVAIDARRAPPKCKLLFPSPLPAGAYELDLQVSGGAPDSTLVFSVPLGPGRYVFTVSTAASTRYDFVFHGEGPNAREDRFTLSGPFQRRVLRPGVSAN
jgi:hypothetical protein